MNTVKDRRLSVLLIYGLPYNQVLITVNWIYNSYKLPYSQKIGPFFSMYEVF